MANDDRAGTPRLGGRLAPALPYLLLLAAAVWLWTVAGKIDYPARPGQIGPDFWPRVAIAMMGLLSLFQIAKIMVSGREAEASGVGDQFDDGEEQVEGAVRSPLLLVLGIALTLGYAAVLGILGFPLATAIFLIAFMYLGGARNHLAIWASSLIGVAIVAVLLLKVVYVSLPRGVAPFDRIIDLIVAF